jgi:hypothetical protein
MADQRAIVNVATTNASTSMTRLRVRPYGRVRVEMPTTAKAIARKAQPTFQGTFTFSLSRARTARDLVLGWILGMNFASNASCRARTGPLPSACENHPTG